MPFRLKSPAQDISENDVERDICNYLTRRGWKMRRNHVGRFRGKGGTWITIGEVGMPDWTATKHVRPGVELVIWIEVKRPGKKPTADQEEWMRRGRIMGLLVEWFDSAEQLDRWIARANLDRTVS